MARAKKKTEKEDLNVLGIAAAAVAVIILGMIYIFAQNAGSANVGQNEGSVTQQITASVTVNPSGVNSTESAACASNEVYFIYADWCPHCQKMKPMATQLASEGYKFVMVNSQDGSALSAAKDCLGGIAQLQYIPEFVCMGNAKDHVGEFASIDEMRAFAEACNALQ